MLFIDNDAVRDLLTIQDCIDVQDESFRRLDSNASIHRPRIDMYVPTGRQDDYFRWGTMEGADKELGVFAIRMKSDILTWPHHDDGTQTVEKYCVRPGTYCGFICLFSTRNGEPLAFINDGVLQHMRVGAAAGLGAKYLAREDSHRVGMIGSGGMARTFLSAFCAVRPIVSAKVYSPTQKHREEYAVEMSEALGISVEPVASSRDAVSNVDIVAACTDSMHPVFDGEWLESGVHVTNVGGREMDAAVYQKAAVTIRQGIGSLRLESGAAGYIAGSAEEMAIIPESLRGLGAESDVSSRAAERNYPTFMDLVAGRVKGRKSDADITHYLNVGNQGLQFAAVGAKVLERANEARRGRQVPTEWFLQDIRD
jgi:alanine dehydrogenase